MHDCDSRTHEETGDTGSYQAHRLAAYDEERNCRGHNGGNHGKEDGRPIVQNLHRKAERFHSHIVHAPDAKTKRKCPAAEPYEPGEATRCSNPASQLKSRISGEYSYKYRNHDQAVVVRAREGHSGVHGLPLGLLVMVVSVTSGACR